MKFSVVKLEDINLEVEGLGTVPLIALIPEVFQLSVNRTKIQADYVCETIKNLTADELSETEETKKMLKAMNDIDKQKKEYLLRNKIPAKLLLLKLGENNGVTESYEMFSERTMYVDSRTFNQNATDELGKSEYFKTINLNEIAMINSLFATRQR